MNPTDVHISAAMTNLSIRYGNGIYIADLVARRIPVGKQADYFYVYDKSHFRIHNTFIGHGKAEAPTYAFGLSSDTYFCEKYGLKDLVTQDDVDNADPAVSPEADSVEASTDALMVSREYRVASKLTSVSNITSYTTLSATSQFSDYSSGVSDPIGVIKTGIETVRSNTGQKPNYIAMDEKVALTIAAHPDMVDLVKGHTAVAEATILNVLRDLFGLTPIIGSAVYNSANYGGADVLAPVWGKDILLGYNGPKMGKKTVSTALTFDWRGRVVETWGNNDPKGTWYKVEERGLSEKIIGATLGYLIKAAIA